MQYFPTTSRTYWKPSWFTIFSYSIRATSHMSQEPWPWNGEGPWLSSKGRTMGVGKAVLCSHGLSSILWSENGPCCGIVACFVDGKRGEDLVQYNMSQTLSIWENYLVVFVCPGICPTIYPTLCHARTNQAYNYMWYLVFWLSSHYFYRWLCFLHISNYVVHKLVKSDLHEITSWGFPLRDEVFNLWTYLWMRYVILKMLVSNPKNLAQSKYTCNKP